MTTRIRLRRMGSNKRPFFRVVVADQRSPRDGRFIENIGKYHPLEDPSVTGEAERTRLFGQHDHVRAAGQRLQLHVQPVFREVALLQRHPVGSVVADREPVERKGEFLLRRSATCQRDQRCEGE